MSREILFRGKVRTYTRDSVIDTDKWAYGYYCRPDGEAIIYDDDKGLEYSVGPATVGQFTGLVDKNGKKIFEGDIIVNDAGIKGIVEYFNELTWDGGCPHPGFYCKEWIEGIATDTDMFYHYNFSKVLVIGNIHDTSKLAKEESE